MTLKEYLEKNKISIENAAKDLGFLMRIHAAIIIKSLSPELSG